MRKYQKSEFILFILDDVSGLLLIQIFLKNSQIEIWTFLFPVWKRLFAGTLPANKNLFAGTTPANKNLFAGTLPANKNLFAGTPKVGSIYTF